MKVVTSCSEVQPAPDMQYAKIFCHFNQQGTCKQLSVNDRSPLLPVKNPEVLTSYCKTRITYTKICLCISLGFFLLGKIWGQRVQEKGSTKTNPILKFCFQLVNKAGIIRAFWKVIGWGIRYQQLSEYFVYDQTVFENMQIQV